MLAQVFNPTEIKERSRHKAGKCSSTAPRLTLHSGVRGAAHHGPKLRRCSTQRQRTIVGRFPMAGHGVESGHFTLGSAPRSFSHGFASETPE